MRPPHAVKTLNLSLPWAENLKTIRESKYSRFPVIEEGQPLPVGIAHVKDILHQELNKQESPDLKTILRPYLKTTDDVPLETLLSKLQHLRRRVAIVADRKGQWVGFMTLEDVIEEIIGSVEDEFEKEPPLFLADAMSVSRILIGLNAKDITDAVSQIINRVDASELPAPREKIIRTVLEREAEMSTYLGHGLAVPHARLEGIDKPFVIFAQSATGIPIKGSTEHIHLIFLLLTPSSVPIFQVRLLARISGLMQNEHVAERLQKVRDPKALYEFICAADPAVLG